MVDETFEGFVGRERERLRGEREAVHAQQQELETKLTAINREFAAIDAYEAAKSGKTVKASVGNAASRGRGARRGSKREALLTLIKENPAGLKRGEILDRMGLKGDKAGEMSVSNALTALIKGGQVRREEGKYRAAA